MSNRLEKPCNEGEHSVRSRAGRREFLRLAGRLGALGVLAAIGAVLPGWGRVGRGGQACTNDGICGSCVAFTRCGLPEAAVARQATRKANP